MYEHIELSLINSELLPRRWWSSKRPRRLEDGTNEFSELRWGFPPARPKGAPVINFQVLPILEPPDHLYVQLCSECGRIRSFARRYAD